ncbi:MAG: hemerythrin domain-containing protein [Bacteroidales bacterium]|nr:hemerythrin domain-containing protein [Bacteroidales bacterium]
MYQTHRTFIKADMKMSELIKENPRLLMLLEHLEIDFMVSDKTVGQLCSSNSVPLQLFVVFGNLYNGFYPDEHEISPINEIAPIIGFLKKSHIYYKTDKYPEILSLIRELKDKTNIEEVKLIERFFHDYFNEVLEHLDYEDSIAFPYFMKLLGQKNCSGSKFSVKEYKEHHTDIETKLADLKNLLLKHIQISNELALRRKLFLSLAELESDLLIHALIEEKILLPLVAEVEKKCKNG